MARVLVTGMSGTGKSSLLAELARRGHRVVDTDEGDWMDGLDWHEAKIERLLDEEPSLFVSGCVENQGRFYDRFDAVVLLSAPTDVLLERIATRTTNDYGKSEAERAEIVANLATIEPLLRASCTHELDATRPLSDLAGELERIAEGAF